MRPSHRLRALQVRKPGHHDVHLALGAIDRHLDQRPQISAQSHQLLTKPHARVRRHLIVSRPSRVQLARDVADELRQTSLVRRVNVLVPGFRLERVSLPLLRHVSQSRHDGVPFIARDDPRARQRRRVPDRPVDVLPPHAPVKGQRFVKLLHERVLGLAESPAPQFFRLLARVRARRRRADPSSSSPGTAGNRRVERSGRHRARRRHHGERNAGKDGTRALATRSLGRSVARSRVDACRPSSVRGGDPFGEGFTSRDSLSSHDP